MPRDKEAILLELLVLRCKRGDRQALDQLIQRWQPRLFYYVRRLVANEEDAWDVLQQCWLRVFKGIKSLDDPKRLPTWLYRVARTAAMSHWRGYYRSQSRRAEVEELTEIAVEEDDCRLDDAEQAHYALGRVSLAHREVLTLFFLEDLSLAEMAEILDIPLGTVKSRLCYAKRAIRDVLREEETP